MKLKYIAAAAAVGAFTALSVGALNGLPEGQWYTEAVSKAAQSGFISYENDTFAEGSPATVGDVNTVVQVIAALEETDIAGFLSENAADNATRGYLCDLLGMLLCSGSDDVPETRFLPDVSIFDSDSSYIFALYDAGILCGSDEDGTFERDRVLYKEEMAALLMRYLYPEYRVQTALSRGVSVRDAFDRFAGEKTDSDNAAYAITDTGFVLTDSMYGFASEVQGEDTAYDTLCSLGAIEKILYLYGYRVSDAMFDNLYTNFDADWMSSKAYIAENGMNVSQYAYYQNYVLSNYYDVASAEFLYYDMPSAHDIFVDYGGSYVLAKHILIQSDGTEAGDAAALETITEVKKQLDGGADFDTLMAQYGEDPGMKQTPGGYCFTRGEMVEEFENAAFALDENQISDIVKTSYGYHIIFRLPLTEEIFCSNTDLIENIALYTAYGDWQTICNVIASTLVVEKQ